MFNMVSIKYEFKQKFNMLKKLFILFGRQNILVVKPLAMFPETIGSSGKLIFNWIVCDTRTYVCEDHSMSCNTTYDLHIFMDLRK